jgi:hypothetical protein
MRFTYTTGGSKKSCHGHFIMKKMVMMMFVKMAAREIQLCPQGMAHGIPNIGSEFSVYE